MAVPDRPAANTESTPLLRARLWVQANWPRYWEVGLFILLMAVAAGLRLWDLGSRAYNHDESMHAQYSWYLYDHGDYEHDPMMHGPFQFVFTALIFKVTDFLAEAPLINNWIDGGPSDYTGRLLAALFGIAIVGLPYFLRGHIGRLGALLAALLLTFSPVLLFFSRFARNDIYIGFWTLAIVVCIWRYLSERKPLYLYLIAGLLALSFATKEVTFMTSALLLIYVNLLLAWQIVSQVRERGGRASDASDDPANPGSGSAVEDTTRARKRKKRAAAPPPGTPPLSLGGAIALYAALIPTAWLVAITWPFTAGWRRRWGLERLPAAGDLLVIIGTLAGVQFAAAIQELPFVGDKGFYRNVDEELLMKGTVLTLIIFSAYFGLLWDYRKWLISAIVFYAIFVVLYTTFFTNLPGFWSGIWGSLDYWLMQQGVQRGDQPVYYYLMIMPMYEFLPVLFALVGGVYFALRQQLFTSFLIFWLLGALVAFAMAGEKMPWLTVHIAIPTIMLAAKLLNDLFERVNVSLPLRWARPGTLLLLCAAAGALAMIVLWATFFSSIGAVIALLIGAIVVGLIIRGGLLHGRLWVAQSAAAVAGAALLILTIRAGALAAYDEGEWPNEMLSYADMSPDMPWLRDKLVEYGEITGLGHDYPIVIDNDLAWPLVWYLRDFNDVKWIGESLSPPVAGSIIALKGRDQTLMEPYLDAYEAPVSIRHLWWFGDGPQYYDDITLKSFFGDLFKGSTWGIWKNYFIHRQPPWDPPPDDGYVYLPRSLEGAGGTAIQPAPSIPTVVAEAEVLVADAGDGRGELNLPTGLAVDAAGNIYVADARNNRIQQFDADGNVMTVLGPGGDKEATLNEPWGVAVDGQGNLYVADTWNHRMKKYDTDFNLVTGWGKPFTELGVRPPQPEELFGPRDVAIDIDGNVLVVDTGNKRVAKFGPDGRPLGSYGEEGTGPGEFNEPVGIAVAANGDIYVADTWNLRVQHFDAAFNYIDEFTVKGWGNTEVTAKPYLVVLADGRIVLSNPANGRIELYDQEGSAVVAWELPTEEGAARPRPVGLALGANDTLLIADCVGNKIYRLPLSALSAPPPSTGTPATP
jgi:predicted membrane-bound mannosyltransferase/DNA-binding beta-propeller fold protein YncE